MSKAGATNIYWECHLQSGRCGNKDWQWEAGKRNVLSEESGKQRRMGRGDEEQENAEESYNEQ